MALPVLFGRKGFVNQSDFPVTVGVPSGLAGAPPVTLAARSSYTYTGLDRLVLNEEGKADKKASILGISPDSFKAITMVASVFTAGFAGTATAAAKSGAGLVIGAATSAPSGLVQKKTTAACRSACGAMT